tara:strand:+ start:2456 stop:2740 length:285 start_codon:yes stop_codon:yes gene_type:complete
MKIKDILKEADDWKQDSTDFKTKVIGRDKTTGAVSWDVKYTPLISLAENIEESYEDFKEVTRKYPSDVKLEQLFKVFTSFKRAYKMHINRKYAK